MTTPYHDALAKRVEQVRIVELETMAQGTAENYADYKYRCGILHGLKLAMDESEALSKQITER